MAVSDPPNHASRTAHGRRASDFSIMVGTANGTGSQTANLALLRSIFRMGVPVHGKNVFPSNIQGLPTWFHIRASAAGWVARQAPEIAVCYNPATLHDDVAALPEGGVLVLNGDLRGAPERDDVTTYRIPVKELMQDVEVKGKLKDYLANMTYLGVVAQVLGIPLDVVHGALDQQFGGRKKLVDANLPVVESAWRWSEANLEKADPYVIEPMDATEDLLLITGNEAAGLGAVFGGVGVAAWYPITPSTSVIDALKGYLGRLRTEEDGTANWAIVQAEDELSAIGMVLGAGWAGARAMTATSGPGLSLMAEFAGLGYFVEVPAVIWDIQRVGPSTGLPTRTSQGDIAFAHNLGHGDAKHPVLLPASVEECFEFGWRAFDIADTAQTPVFVLSDLDLGMNTWMAERFAYPDRPMQRGKVLRGDEIPDGFGRYRDVDGDGIAPRTLPGDPNPQGTWFARGTGHDDHAVYSERAEDWTDNNARLTRKLETLRELVPAPEIDRVDGATLGVVFAGSVRFAVEEARARLDAAGHAFSTLRLRALPFGPEVRDFVAAHDQVVVLEMNRDGQLCGILRAELPDLAPRLASVAHLDGLPFSADQVATWLAPYLGAESATLVQEVPV
ncbi:MAG: 2-oxoacid:acceptor oxidoreductase subunit alpha [Deinococcus-Thermus bacterium]|jgi:2-oxoglutarate ferredoxin oxidoreductase subunit alpha|nr:2-oxoacid:acceptor oxidoreductase subunit alpha [Deinococcota bacterium]